MKTRFPNFIRYVSILVISTFIFSLTSCSSNSEIPLETSYYLLNSEYKAIKPSNINKTVTVEVLELPTYLHQPHLVMQLNTHQLHYARFDMWAEPLQTGLTKALISDLNLNNKNIQFVTDGFQHNAENVKKLVIQVDYFHPSTTSKVILSGVFWRGNNKEKYKVQQPFYFELLLNEDGYTHAITQMRELVSMMSTSILKTNY